MNFKEDSFMVVIALCVVFFVVAQALFLSPFLSCACSKKG